LKPPLNGFVIRYFRALHKNGLNENRFSAEREKEKERERERPESKRKKTKTSIQCSLCTIIEERNQKMWM